MQKVESGVMRLTDGVQTSQPFTAVSKQGHVDGAHEANVPTQTRRGAAERPAARG